MSTSQRALLILADDHRDSLEKQLYKLTGPPTEAQAARIRADKMLVYEALVDATDRLPEGAQAGILIDEEYGTEVAELAENSGGLISLSMPLEASGKDWFEFAYGNDWQRHAERFRTDHAKVLIRDNPSLPAADRARQAVALRQVSEWAASTRHNLIVELLVPAGDDDLKSVGGDAKHYDDELRPLLTLEVIGYLQDNGADPALWKVEGMDRTKDAAAVADLARRDGRTADCIVLGRHSSRADLDRWLDVAAPIRGFTGFAIGRSIWWDPLTDHLAGAIGADVAKARIAQSYLDYANDFMKARTPSVG